MFYPSPLHQSLYFYPSCIHPSIHPFKNISNHSSIDPPISSTCCIEQSIHSTILHVSLHPIMHLSFYIYCYTSIHVHTHPCAHPSIHPFSIPSYESINSTDPSCSESFKLVYALHSYISHSFSILASIHQSILFLTFLPSLHSAPTLTNSSFILPLIHFLCHVIVVNPPIHIFYSLYPSNHWISNLWTPG